MIALIMVLLLSAGAVAQTKSAPDQPLIEFATMPEVQAPAKSLREFALQRIAALEDYEKSRSSEYGDFKYSTATLPGFSFVINNGPVQSFTVHRDGKIDLDGLTLEDAVLVLYSEEADRQLVDLQRFDSEEKQREEARKSVPPKNFRLGKKQWSMSNQPDWSHGAVLGDTNCGLKRVRILETDPDKRGTVMHELMHVASGCQDNAGLHNLIYQLAPNLVKLLRENPDVVEYLTKKEDKR